MNRRAFLALLPALPAAAVAVARAKPLHTFTHEGTYVPSWQEPLVDDDRFLDIANYLHHLGGHYDGIPFFTTEPR